jgi:hypothetical protein
MHANDLFADLPNRVREMLDSAFLAEFATVSALGVPIDTPVGCFLNPDGSIATTTGLAYPAKAERARRNPRVGLLIEGFPDEPVVLIAAMASVRDANIQANVDRYLPEISANFESFSAGYSWQAAREGVHYWSRIIIDSMPQHIFWWDNPTATDVPPARWDAPAGATASASDPAPHAMPTPPSDWQMKPWQEQAEEVIAEALPAHLTLLDEAGFPLPFRVRTITRIDGGFRLTLPAGVPWVVRGSATLCFMARATFVGTVEAIEGGALLHVERALPVLPNVRDIGELWSPTSETWRKLGERLVGELARRGQPKPTIPQHLPEPTPGSLRRAERGRRFAAALGGEPAERSSSAPYLPPSE